MTLGGDRCFISVNILKYKLALPDSSQLYGSVINSIKFKCHNGGFIGSSFYRKYPIACLQPTALGHVLDCEVMTSTTVVWKRGA